ncbi:MAG: hypothetical protein SGI96_12615 [Bacteroidota bacterium]|nr:hypothetical protein [Bacteroidota bacterium]
MCKKIILPAVFVLLCTTILAQNNVAFFEQCNYSGKKSYLTPGSYKGYQMQIDNDKLSSMQIPTGMRVTIYEHDDFKGRSATYTSNTSCLTDGWDDNTSSIVVESMYNQPAYNQNDYVTFYNDCYSKGYSQSLRPGIYYGNQLGSLRLNISSFTVYGNLRVRAYTSSDNASGYSSTFETSESCLSSSYSDKIRSLVVEYKPTQPTISYPNNQPGNNYPSNNNSSSYATIYTDCNYSGSSLRLAPGYYQGDKLGLMKFDISSLEIPSNLRAKVYINNEYLSGTSYLISENTSCLSNTLNNRIGSLVIEERSGYSNPQYPQSQDQNVEKVVLYSDANFKGLSASVLPGTYGTMEQAGFIDDNLSSLFLPPGYRVVLYEFENFRGKNYTITVTKSGFSISGWNDKTSSIAIYRN